MGSTLKELINETNRKYGSGSGSVSKVASSNTGSEKKLADLISEANRLDETVYKPRREKAANNVQKWLGNYNSTLKGYRDYEKTAFDTWDTNFGGEWYEKVLGLRDEYDSIRNDASLIGSNYRDAYDYLNELADTIQKNREYMSQFDSDEGYQTHRRQQEWYQKYQNLDYNRLEKTAAGIEDPEEKEFVQNMAGNARVQRMRNMDITMAQTDIGQLKRQRDQLWNEVPEYDISDNQQRRAAKDASKDYKEKRDRYDSQIAKLEADINEAKRYQKEAELSAVGDRYSQNYDPEFAQRAQFRGDSALSRMINETESERAWRKQQDDVWGASDFSQKGYDRLTQEEKDTYNYWDSYDRQNGTQKAQEYLDSLRLEYRVGTENYEQSKDYNRALKMLSYGAVGMEGALKGIAKVPDMLAGKEDYTPASPTQIAANMLLQDDRENGHKMGGLGKYSPGNLLQDEEGGRTWEEFFGQGAMSIGNMVPSMAVAGMIGMAAPALGAGAALTKGLSRAGSLAVMGAGIAGNTYAEAINQGYSPKNAKAYAYANAASEILTEVAFGGIEGMTGIGTDALVEKLLSTTDNAILRAGYRGLVDGLGETLEEGVQAVIEPWMNNVILHKDEVLRGQDVAYNMLAGFATGFMMSGPSIALDEYGTYRTGKDALNQKIDVDALRGVGESFDIGTEANRLAKKIDKNTGAYTIGRMLNEIGAGLGEQNVRDISRYLQNHGLPADVAERNAMVLNYIAMGGQLSEEQKLMVNENQLLADAFRDMVLDPNSSVNQRTQGLKKLTQGEHADSVPTAEKIVSRRNENGDAALNNPNRAVLAVTSREGDTMQLRLKNGDVVDSSDMTAYHDSSEALLFDTARKYSRDVADANLIANGFEGSNVSMEEYCKGISDSYRYGLYGMSYSEVKRGSMSSAIDAEAARSAYMAGIREANTRVARQQKAAMEARQPGQEAAVHFNRNGRNLDAKRETAIATMDQLSKALGVDFWVFESYEKNGSRVYADETGAEHKAPNGFYDEYGIHIDLNAGNDGRGVMLYTLAHELTHHIRKYSPEKFKAFADVVMKGYGDRNISAENLIQEQIAKAKRSGRDVDYDTAYEEMIADSMEGILADGKVLEKLKGLQESDPSLWETVKQWAKDVAEKIRAIVDAYKGERMDSTEGRVVSNMKEILPQLEELYAEGLADSIGSQMAGLGSTATDIVQSAMHDSGVKYSERVTDKDTLDFLDGQDTVKTYKTMQLVDGKLYPPMASRIEGRYEDYSILGQWEQATEHPELIRENGKFKLDKGKGQGSIEAAYNPYMHSSNLVLNDQFSGAYARDNLVTVECEVPSSELTSGYKAEYAKDAVGWHAWHTGTVAGSLRKAKGIERQVFLSRWIKPVRIVPDSEVAAMYKTLLDGTDVSVPDNVVTPNLLSELKKAGVQIKESGKVKYSERDFTYKELTAKSDLKGSLIKASRTVKLQSDGSIDSHWVVSEVFSQCKSIKTNSSTPTYYVSVPDIGKNVQVTSRGIGHGFIKFQTKNGKTVPQRSMINARVALDIPNILSNSIEVNRSSRGNNLDVDYSHILLGVTALEDASGNVEYYAVRSVVESRKNQGAILTEANILGKLHAVNAKKIGKPNAKVGAINTVARANSSLFEYSVSDLLNDVKLNFDDTFSNDVYSHFGITRTTNEFSKYLLKSDRDPDAGKMNRILQNQNAELRDTVDYLKELVKLQGKVTDGTVYTWGSVEAAARRLMNGAGAKGDVVELRKILEKTYKAMGEGSDSMTGLIDEAAQWLVDHKPEAKPKLDSYAQGILAEIKGRGISLNESQKAEAAHLVGKYGDYRRRFFGTLNISDTANTSLDQFWQEMSGQYPDIFKPDISSADMPRELYSAIDTLKSMYEAQEFSPEEMAEAALNEQRMNVWENFTKLVPIKTTADRNKAQVEAIKQQYTEKIQSIRENYQSQIDQLKRQRREDVKAVRAEMQGKADAQQQAAKERFQQQKEDLKAAREDTQIIEREFLRLARECEKAIKAGDTAQSKADSLKAALEAETKKHKQDNAMWEKEFKRLFREYEKSDRNVDALQEKLEKTRASAKARVEGRKQTAIRNQLKDIHGKLQKMILNPGKGVTAHAPTALTQAVADVCEMFVSNLEQAGIRQSGEYDARIEMLSGKLAENPNLKYARTGIDTAERQNARIAEQSRKLGELKRKYEAIQKGKDAIYYDESVSKMLGDLKDMLDGKDIYEMTSQELEAVRDTMKSFQHAIETANRIFLGDHNASLTETAQQWGKEISDVNVGFIRKYMNPASRFMQWQMSPDTMFMAFSGFAKNSVGEQVQKMFAKGTQRKIQVDTEYYNQFAPIMENKQNRKELNRLLGNPAKKKNLVDVGLKDRNGDSVQITRGMAMQLYMLLGQRDSLEALVYSGLKVPNMRKYYTDRSNAYGDIELSKARTSALGESAFELYDQIRNGEHDLKRGELGNLSEAELLEKLDGMRGRLNELVMGEEARLLEMRNTIEGMLTPLEKQCIEAARKWYARSGELMADTHEEMHGFRPRLIDDYVPIHRNGETVWTDIRDVNAAFNLENSGFLKERVKNQNAILLTDFFVELGSQRDAIATYCGYALAQKDFGRLWKMKLPGGISINEMIGAKFGTGNTKLGVSGVQYVTNYIEDIAGGRKSGEGPLDFFYGATASANLALNPRVAFSQLASIPTAAAAVGWKNMGVGFVKGLKTAVSKNAKNELAQKNAFFFQRYRGSGGITEIADLQGSSGLWNRVSQSRAGKWLFNWCQAFDVFATSTMYAMAEEAAVSRGYTRGEAGFDEVANEIYTEIIRRTQPNYTVTERSDLLRDNRSHMKMLNMFKTQSNQNLNILMQSSGKLAKMMHDFRDGKNGVTRADVTQAAKDFARAGSAVILGGTVSFVLARTAVNFVMAQVRSYRDDETGEVTDDRIRAAMFQEFLSSMAGMVTLGDTAYDIIYSVASGGKFYGLTDSAVGAVCDAVQDGLTVLKKSLSEDGWDSEEDRKADIQKAIISTFSAFGVPAGNALKFVDAYEHWKLNIEKGSLRNYDDSDTTKAQYRNRFLKYYRAGEEDKCNDILAILAVMADKPNVRRADAAIRTGFRDSFKEKFLKGEVTEEEVLDIMVNYLDADPEDVELMIAGWKGKQDTGMTLDEIQDKYLRYDADSEHYVSPEDYIQYLMDYQGKDQKEAEEAELRLRCERDTGYAYDEIKQAYMEDEITASDAAQWLGDYGKVENPEKKLKEYDFEDETGYSWDDKRMCYLDGAVSKPDFKRWLMDIDGKRSADADYYIGNLDFEKENGYAYNEKLEKYISGEITRQQLKQALMTKGGMFEAEADRELVAYDYIKNHPNTQLSISTAYSYTRKINNCDYTLQSAGFTEEQFLSFREKKNACNGTDNDGDGYRDSGSVQAQVLPIIDAMPISAEQKDTLWFFCGWSKKTLPKKAPWHTR